MQPTAQQGAHLGAQNQVLGAARASPPAHPVAHEVGRGAGFGTAGLHQAHGIARHRLGDRHAAHQTGEIEHILARKDDLHLLLDQGGGVGGDRKFLVFVEIVDADIEHEAIQLGFGQRVGALQFDRILGGEDVERLFQEAGSAADTHLLLLHRLQQRGLGLGRGAIDLVGQQHVGEDRAGHEAQLAMPADPVLVDDLGAGDVRRHQVRGELYAAELEVENARDGADEQGFGQARSAGDEAVAPGEQRDHQRLDHFLLADDDLVDLGQHLFTAPAQPVQDLLLQGRSFAL